MNQYIKTIESRAQCVNIKAEIVLAYLLKEYPRFAYWSGSHNEILHHYGQGGLAQHTSEVLELGFSCRSLLHKESEVDAMEYFFAALFHDTGKMFDYDIYGDQKNEQGELVNPRWEPTEHRRLIHHLPRSVLIWHDIISKYPDLNDRYHDSVVHAILAHHGRREAGSPVAPKTAVAWLLHLCDGISARMDDCDTLDIVHRPANV